MSELSDSLVTLDGGSVYYDIFSITNNLIYIPIYVIIRINILYNISYIIYQGSTRLLVQMVQNSFIQSDELRLHPRGVALDTLYKGANSVCASYKVCVQSDRKYRTLSETLQNISNPGFIGMIFRTKKKKKRRKISTSVSLWKFSDNFVAMKNTW